MDGDFKLVLSSKTGTPQPGRGGVGFGRKDWGALSAPEPLGPPDTRDIRPTAAGESPGLWKRGCRRFRKCTAWAPARGWTFLKMIDLSLWLVLEGELKGNHAFARTVRSTRKSHMCLNSFRYCGILLGCRLPAAFYRRVR